MKQNRNENNEFEHYEKEFDDLFEKNFNKPSILEDEDKLKYLSKREQQEQY